MNPTPSPNPINVIVHSGGAEWWEIVAALGPLVVLVAAGIGWFALRRRTFPDAVALDFKTSAGSHPDWWPRARWALEATLDDKPARQEVGLAALELLNASSLSGKEETLIIAEAWKKPLRDSRAMSRLAEKESAGEHDSQSGISSEERVIIRAARLRLATDKKQRIESPTLVREVAKLPLSSNP